MTAAARDRLRPVAGVAVVLAAVGLLHRLGAGPLAAPPFPPGEDLTVWLEARDPVTIGFAIFRLGALVLAYHLAITSSVAAAGHLLHRPDLVRTASAWTLPPFRGAVRRVVGLGLSAAAALTTPVPVAGAATPASTATAIAGPGTATLRAVGPEVTVLAPDGGGGTTVTLRLAPAPTPDGTASMTEVATSPSAPAPTALPTPVDERTAGPAVDPPASASHVVRPGDHLWRIADDRLTAFLGRAPTDDEVAPYWRRVVDANPQLVDPDLLFVGDVVTVPAP